VEGHSSKLEQVEDRISELEDKIDIEEKTESRAVKGICEELRDSIKRPNMRIKGIKEGEEV
jgi:CRISPR/Cas system type I-B associated protein Csh2 (Cas7 group RAMP superfamily)